ncbi:hypothetical protein HanXRQr2_Chr10g0432281 [Helianthus annuus]|uniref:Uncharacterized protein n=1 Tax=Helianthus annuus TaxID=4232 RepID=A0A251TIC4_HELAN|nr:hypothetical protein HanXRQr2_Chr10g0432281 [Helianthus annuus]KAJ0513265.1 hypothetical protein HanHA300_Chr10g0355571 [Helianthus annuus]KAJ0529379.1 hypothetical protein HanHA89_Chr10g0377161 [Helianthus annuus]KAJ0696266.1 hypothetical protein HanLR1_Chr10g0355071 [Helianthus annuus]
MNQPTKLPPISLPINTQTLVLPPLSRITYRQTQTCSTKTPFTHLSSYLMDPTAGAD